MGRITDDNTVCTEGMDGLETMKQLERLFRLEKHDNAVAEIKPPADIFVFKILRNTDAMEKSLTLRRKIPWRWTE